MILYIYTAIINILF